MQLKEVLIKYTHPAITPQGIEVEAEYSIITKDNKFYVNEIEVSLKQLKGFFSPVNCKNWDEVVFESVKAKTQNK